MALFSTTLSSLRQHLSAQVGDLILSTPSTATGGTTAVDTKLRKGDDYYNEHQYRGYCYAGTAIGQEREISDWDNATNTVTFAPAFSPALTTGDKLELHQIFTEDEYRKAINQAIEFAADDYLLDDVNVATVLSTNIYEYAMPGTPEFQYVHQITKETTAGSGIFQNKYIIKPDFYQFIKVGTASYIKFDEEDFKIPVGENGKHLRIEGQKRQAKLTADTSICYMPLDWVVAKAITYLPNSKMLSENLNKTLEIALNFAVNVPRRRPYPKSKRVLL